MFSKPQYNDTLIPLPLILSFSASCGVVIPRLKMKERMKEEKKERETKKQRKKQRKEKERKMGRKKDRKKLV